MKISQLYLAPSISAGKLSNNVGVNISEPLIIDTRVIYRKTYFLHFKLESSTDGIHIDSEQSAFSGYLDRLIYRLYPNDSVYQQKEWEAIKENPAEPPNLVLVRLTHPWRLLSVQTNDSRGVEVLRLDGNAVSSEPTIYGNANSTFADEFIAQEFALKKVGVFPVKRVISKTGINAKTPDQQKKSQSNSLISLNEGFQQAELSEEIAINQSEQDQLTLVPDHGIKYLLLKSIPTGPRVLMGKIGETVNAEAKLISVWQAAGEALQIPVNFLQTQTERDNFFTQLQKACNDYIEQRKQAGMPIENDIFLPLVFESDTPATLQLNEIDFRYFLIRNRFNNIEDKISFNFSGTTIENKTLNLNMPINSSIHTAHLEIMADFKAPLKFGDAVSSTSIHDDLSSSVGVRANPDQHVFMKISLNQAQHVNNIALAVMPLNTEVHATVQVIENANDGPNGTLLGETELILNGQERRQWSIAQLRDTLLLDAKEYWICMYCKQGDVIWLGEAAVSDIRVKSVQQKKQVTTKKITNVSLLYHLAYSLAEDLSSMQSHQLLEFTIGGDSAVLTSEENNKLHYNFTNALMQYSQSHSTEAIPLLIKSPNKGSLTIYSPRVTYDIE